MFIQLRTLSLPLILAAGLTLPAIAQETTTTPSDPAVTAPAPAPKSPAAPGGVAASEAEAAVNQLYLLSKSGDWELRCNKTTDGSDPCQLYQLLNDDKGNSVAEISLLALPAGGKAAAGATVVVPLETLLPQQLTIEYDGKDPKHYPFAYCSGVGCFARIGLTTDDIEKMKSGKVGVVSVVPAIAPDQTVSVKISLTGFTDGFAALQEATPGSKP